MPIKKERLFVIKQKEFYVFLHEDKNDISLECTDLENAMKFTKDELHFIYEKFKEKWERNNYEVYRLVFTEIRNYTWF